jgi:uncharacterized membrane protein YbhN (UPF0104 family)
VTGARRAASRAGVGLAAGAALAALAAWWLGVRPHDIAHRLQGVSAWVLVGCMGSALVVVGLQTLRRRIVTGPHLGLGYGRLYGAQLLGLTLNAVLPARGGDLVRVEYLCRKSGTSRATVLGVEIVDRWVDWWGWFPVLVVLAATCRLPGWLYAVFVALVVALAAWAALMLSLGRRGYVPRPGSRLGAIYARLLVGLRVFRDRRTLYAALAVAPLPWLWETGALALAARAFHLHLSFATAFSVLVAFNVATAIPSPEAAGSVAVGGTAALVLLGVDHPTAISFTFAYHFAQLVPVATAGGFVLLGWATRRTRGAQPAGPLPYGSSAPPFAETRLAGVAVDAARLPASAVERLPSETEARIPSCS